MASAIRLWNEEVAGEAEVGLVPVFAFLALIYHIVYSRINSHSAVERGRSQ